jgi:hypothetical protein
MESLKRLIVISLCSLILINSLFTVTAEEDSLEEVELRANADRTFVETKDSITLSFTLKNIGDTMIRLVNISGVSCGWIYLDIKDSRSKEYHYLPFPNVCISAPPWATNESLTELNPGDEISGDLIFSLQLFGIYKPGEYFLRGKYSTLPDYVSYYNVTAPFWEGRIESNVIVIKVFDNTDAANLYFISNVLSAMLGFFLFFLILHHNKRKRRQSNQ